jgi:peptidoglycan/xylan/chitin deacetylase (PgdA/CDA1 family)
MPTEDSTNENLESRHELRYKFSERKEGAAMKRTILPKILGLLLIGIVWVLWPASIALPLSLALGFGVVCALTIPVLNPQSNFYVPTVSSADDRTLSKQVALTFDDGPDPRFTMKILDQLAAEDIRAAFFVVGTRAERYPELIQAIVDRGHILGNHSHRHGMKFHFSGHRHLHRELDAFDSVIRSITGFRCQLFRAPQGFRTPILADVLRQRKLHCVAWSARGYDAVEKNPRKILQTIEADLEGGGIVLLHDGGGLGGSQDRSGTLEALPLLICAVRARGLTFERLDRLIGVEAYSQ